jgi:hypothetical protein
MRYVKKYGTAGQTTDGNVMRRMRVALWINNATNTHSECKKKKLLFQGNNRYANAP